MQQPHKGTSFLHGVWSPGDWYGIRWGIVPFPHANNATITIVSCNTYIGTVLTPTTIDDIAVRSNEVVVFGSTTQNIGGYRFEVEVTVT